MSFVVGNVQQKGGVGLRTRPALSACLCLNDGASVTACTARSLSPVKRTALSDPFKNDLSELVSFA